MDRRVSIRAHFERFPATLKGAFVLRGEDPDPHQVRIESARVAEMGGRAGQAMAVEPVTLDVAPHLDLFVPFEVPLLDLGPGWYRLELDVVVDGDPGMVHPGARFVVAWPRGSMRRGSVTVAKPAPAGASTVTIEHVECAADSVRVTYSAPARVGLSLATDDVTLPQIDEAYDSETGRGKVITYPAAKVSRMLAITTRGAERPLEIELPDPAHRCRTPAVSSAGCSNACSMSSSRFDARAVATERGLAGAMVALAPPWCERCGAPADRRSRRACTARPTRSRSPGPRSRSTAPRGRGASPEVPGRPRGGASAGCRDDHLRPRPRRPRHVGAVDSPARRRAGVRSGEGARRAGRGRAGLPVRGSLRRAFSTGPQAKRDAAERREAMRGSFIVRERASCPPGCCSSTMC